MLQKNIEIILEQITPSDVVLDIGGWAQPFNRANYVIDILPYETRGYAGSNGPKEEYFSKDTWILQDISTRKPLPFKDKEIDYVICSHTLEDIRDPLHLCSEIIRIGKRGYIEVPSRTLESIMGLEGKNYPGYYHHRWLIEVEGSKIIFQFKSHLMYNSWKYTLPKSYLKEMKEEDKFAYLFWDGDFQYEEIIQISKPKVAHDLEEFVRRKKGHSSFTYKIDDMKKAIKDISLKIQGKYNREESQELDFPEIHSK